MGSEGNLRGVIDSVTSVWRTWNIHGFVLISLLIQLILLFAAPLRKKSTHWITVGLIWSLYQLADTAITHAMSIMKSATSDASNKAAEDVGDLYTLWAVCLLLHFGGPDTITAFSMEDNKLWRRSWLRFSVQVEATLKIVATGIVARSMKPKKPLLQQPYILASSFLIYLAGIAKSHERILCLVKASPRVFGSNVIPGNPDPGPDYAALMEQYISYKERGIPVEFVEEINKESCFVAAVPTIDGPRQDLDDAQITQQAYRYYNKFKGTFVDRVFCCHDRMEARDVFIRLSWQAAYTVVETEMKFAYEAFYTKSPLFAYPMREIIRFISFSFESAALFLWVCSMHLFQSDEALVTTCLLAGAVFMDIVGFIRLYLSEWKIAHSAAATSFSHSQIALPFRPFFLYMRRRRWGDYPQDTSPFLKFLRILFRQWSESISQFNFIDYCIHKRHECLNTLYTCLGAKGMMDAWQYVTNRWFTNNLREFIFEELHNKSSIAQTLQEEEDASSSRGGWILRYSAGDDLNPATFEPYVLEVEYDESLLMWHIATELCYETGEMPSDRKEQEYRTFSKILSDYMLYLSVRQPKLMSGVAPMAEVIFKDSCAEADRFLQREMPIAHRNACVRIMQVKTSAIPPGYLKEEEDNSVLFDASELAKRLKSVKRNQWKFVSQMWVELLCYAAAHTPGFAHAMLLSEGGELVTLVRLLMLHFGLSNQFREAKNIPRVRLVVDKHS